MARGIYTFYSYIWQYTLSTFKILKNSKGTKKGPFSIRLILTLTAPARLLRHRETIPDLSTLDKKSWTSITELWYSREKVPRHPKRKPHQELCQTRCAGCRGGLKSPLPLPSLYWHQQWHTRILRGLLVFLACLLVCLRIFRNKYVPHEWGKVKMLALEGSFNPFFTLSLCLSEWMNEK